VVRENEMPGIGRPWRIALRPPSFRGDQLP
jgi:hypothetical protein